MALILCDCGCGKTIEKKVYYSNTCRMRVVRGHAPELHSVRNNAQIPLNTVRADARIVTAESLDSDIVDEGVCPSCKKVGREVERDDGFNHFYARCLKPY